MNCKYHPMIQFLVVVLTCIVALSMGQESILNSPHNLSASGPGPVRAISEDRVCIFCHTPHGARSEAPLWNRRDSSAYYTPYDSLSITAKPGQPTGSSKLCLSCHDGTIALGDLVSEQATISMGGSDVIPPGHARIGTDLRDDHPISFPYSESLSRPKGELAPPHSWDPAIRLDAQGMLQCTTCHDPHDNQWDKFLVMSNHSAALCRECHRIDGFDNNAHAISGNTWNGGGRDPWPHTNFETVASNACMNCHRSHHAPGPETLLTSSRADEVCLTCHDGSVSDVDISADFRKPYRHPVMETSAMHRPGERLTGAADHVTCVDCHNPHKAESVRAQAPFINGYMQGVSGVTESGTYIEEAVFEYEVCFKCHSDSRSGFFSPVNRQISTGNLRRQFSSSSPSFHPITSTGMNSSVPSLISPLNESSMIYCTDCHGSDSSSGPGSRTTSAPHGSRYPYMLGRQYQTEGRVTESPSAYALCYSCHDRSSILANESFPQHRSHIVDHQASCSVCHDPHGIDELEGNPINHANLINFDLSTVEPLPSTGMIEYTSHGTGSGTCSLRCHGSNHDDRWY
jgi:predicted CXXCH cytochrome family protein